MAIQLKIGSSVVGGTDNPTPAVSITTEGVHHPVTGALVAVSHNWDVNGILLDKGAASIDTQAETLRGLFESAGGNETVQLLDGSTVLAELVGANAIEGLKIDPPSFREGSGVEWATKRTYSLKFTADFAVTGVTEWAEFTLATSTDERGIESRALDGIYHKPTSSDIESDCKTYVATLLPADGSHYQRTDSYSKDGVSAGVYGKSCRFTIADTGLWKQLPNNCSSANVTKGISRRAGSRAAILSLSGSFTGRDRNIQPARDAVDLMLSQYAHLSKLTETINENEYEGTVSFNASFLEPDSDVIEFKQQITIQDSFDDFVMQPILDGRQPIRQDTVVRPARAIQTGYRVTTYSPAPEPAWWSYALKNPSVTYSSPDRDIDNQAMLYRVDWNYQFEFDRAPAFAGF